MAESKNHIEGGGEDGGEVAALREALRLSEERFKLISLATNDALWDWDLKRQGLVGGKLLYHLPVRFGGHRTRNRLVGKQDSPGGLKPDQRLHPAVHWQRRLQLERALQVPEEGRALPGYF
jgi:PAS domain-containing protein